MRCTWLPKEVRLYLGLREGGPRLEMAIGSDQVSGCVCGGGLWEGDDKQK